MSEPPTQWSSFLRSYAAGNWMNNEKHAGQSDKLDGSLQSLGLDKTTEAVWDDTLPSQAYDSHLYPSTVISQDTAEVVRQFVAAKDYLPPPRSPQEELRIECIKQYDIYSPDQTINIQRAVDVVASFFPSAIVTFTLFDGRTQLFVAMGGDQELLDRYDLTLRVPIPSYHSLCGHAVLHVDRAMFVPDLQNDFRFRSNPYVSAGVLSYIGSSVSLLLDPLFGHQGMNARVGIGSLNVLFIDHKQDSFSTKERSMIENITRMLESQLRGTWEAVSRSREGMMRHAVSDLIEASLVKEKKRNESSIDFEAPLTPSVAQRRTDDEFASLATRALQSLRQLLSDASGVTIVDTRNRSRDQVCLCITIVKVHVVG